jgi:3-oxoadipate enol-lactonase
MAFADVNGIRIHYQLDGPSELPAVVLSNSLGTDLSLWEPQLAALSSRFRVLRYDTRGHGNSDAPPGPYTADMLGKDVLGLLDSLRISAVHFCGISMGGMTGMWLGVNAPQRVRRLVLCNTAAQFGAQETWDTRIAAVQSGGMASIAGVVLGRWLTPEFQARRPDEAERLRRMLLSTPALGYIANCIALREVDLREVIARIRTPTLVVAGSKDSATTPAQGRFIADRIQGARYVELEAAHLSNIESSGLFTETVSAFLAEQRQEG